MSSYLILIVADGVRYDEAFGTPANIPNILALAANGSILTEMYGDPNAIGLTSTCPGHGALLTGRFENLPNDGSQSPLFPSFFQEWLYFKGIRSNPTDGFTDQAKIILSKDKLYMLGTNLLAGSYQNYLPYINAGVNGDGTGGYRPDATTHALFKTECLGASPPILSMVGYASADSAAHAGNWAAYNAAIQTIDGYIGEIVSLVSQHPLMAGNTTFIITTDHGRQAGAGWQNHGGSTLSERHAFLVAAGEDIKVNYVSNTTYASIDVARTALALVEYTKANSDGVLISDIIAEDHFTQSSVAGLANNSFTFTPNSSDEFYDCCREIVSSFFVTPADETDLVLPSDSYIEIILPTDKRMPFFGSTYDRFFVGSNGYITFNSGDTTHTQTLAAHFSLPRISGMFSDFGAFGGTSFGSIYFLELTDRIAITYKGMQHFPGGGIPTSPLDCQIEMFFDGRIRVTYLRVAAIPCIIGLSKGDGIPPDFVESDFLSYGIMPFAPTDLTAGGISPDRIMLRWVDNSDFDVAFKIERKGPGEDSFSFLATVPSGETVGPNVSRAMSYVDEDLFPGTSYTYRVFAENKTCVSDPTNEATGTTRPTPVPAPPPSPVDFEIHPIRQDELDQLQIGVRLSMVKMNRQWNELVGSEWFVKRIVEGTPRKVVVQPVGPHQAESEWTVTDSQLREHFGMTLDIPGPPSQIQHL
jgi:hypothetical protein